MQRQGFNVAVRSDGQRISGSTDVYLVDILGLFLNNLHIKIEVDTTRSCFCRLFDVLAVLCIESSTIFSCDVNLFLLGT